MDGNKVIGFKQEEGNKCQFYVILGNRDFRPPRDHNVYINATGVRDFNLIKSSILKNWQKQRKIMPVSDKIIYFIPSEEYRSQANEIIQKTGFYGEVQVMAPKVEVQKVKEESVVVDPLQVVSEKSLGEENTDKDVAVNEEKTVRESGVVVNDGAEVKSSKIVDMAEYQARLGENLGSGLGTAAQVGGQAVESKNDYSYKPPVYKPEVPIYRGDNADVPITGGGTVKSSDVGADSALYNGYNQTLINQNVRKLVKVKGSRNSHKSAAFARLPVMIFILSALLLIASIILLFVVD